jgi:hypothetical protein
MISVAAFPSAEEDRKVSADDTVVIRKSGSCLIDPI